MLLAEAFYLLLAKHELFNVICLFLYEIKPLGGKEKPNGGKNYNDMNLYRQLRKRSYLLVDTSLVSVFSYESGIIRMCWEWLNIRPIWDCFSEIEKRF